MMRLESAVFNTSDSRYFDKYPRNLLLCNTLLIGFYVANQEIDLLNIVISKNLSKRVITTCDNSIKESKNQLMLKKLIKCSF